MEIQTHCPACGAPLTISTQENRLVCSFCSSRFAVDLSESEPKFSLEQPAERIETAPLPPAGSLPEFSTGGSSTGAESVPLAGTVVGRSSSTIRLMGGRLWVAIAMAVTVVFCGSCLCTLLLARTLFK